MLSSFAVFIQVRVVRNESTAESEYKETAPSKLYYDQYSLKGCINGTRVTFVPAQVHPGFLSGLCIRLNDTAQKIHSSRTQRNPDKVLCWCSVGSLLAKNERGILERP